MSRRLAFIVIWGAVSLSVSMSLLSFLVIIGDLALWWLVPLLGVGLPTVGLVSALFKGSVLEM